MNATEITATNVFKRNLDAYQAGFRRIVNKGGTSSSKTYSILQLLLYIARQRASEGVHISVVSETLPHLKLGAIRDFNAILKMVGYREGWEYSQANHAYKIGKSVVEFFSADIEKATGPRRDILFLNECNNIAYNIVSELEQRTKETIFYDFNPVEVFWIEDKVLSLPRDERELIKSNYLDNDHLDAAIAHEIEIKAQRDPNFKRIHIDVQYGVYEGLIFPSFNIVPFSSMPKTDKQRYGLDFGFTNDPTTLLDVRIQSGAWWVDELLYRTGMTNPEIAKELKGIGSEEKLIGRGVGRQPVIADSSEPKSIYEISLAGINIRAAEKGPDSIRLGIDRIKSMPMNVTDRSVHLIKELRSYRYRQDPRTGVFLNEPVDAYNHLIDPWRYAGTDLTRPSTGGPKAWLASR